MQLSHASRFSKPRFIKMRSVGNFLILSLIITSCILCMKTSKLCRFFLDDQFQTYIHSLTWALPYFGRKGPYMKDNRGGGAQGVPDVHICRGGGGFSQTFRLSQ